MIQFEILILDSNEFVGEKISKNLKILNRKIDHLKHGDVVVMSATERLKNEKKFFSEAKFFIVCELDENLNDKMKNEKYLCELSRTPNEWSCIPIEISKSISKKNPNFIQLYENMLKENFSNCLNSYKAIELDFQTHLKLLPDSIVNNLNLDSNNNTNKKELSIFYFFENPIPNCNEKFDGDFYICNKSDSGQPIFSLVTDLESLNLNNLSDSDALNASLNEEDLDLNKKNKLDLLLENIEERDLEMEEYAKNFKKVYENEFKDYLKKLKKNEPMSVTSMPTKKYCKETYEEDSMSSTTLVFYFDSLECDENENINAVIATSFDKSMKYHFHPYFCDTYGIYFNMTLYTCVYNVGRKTSEDNLFFLDLPIHLYNLLDSDD